MLCEKISTGIFFEGVYYSDIHVEIFSTEKRLHFLYQKDFVFLCISKIAFTRMCMDILQPLA